MYPGMVSGMWVFSTLRPIPAVPAGEPLSVRTIQKKISMTDLEPCETDHPEREMRIHAPGIWRDRIATVLMTLAGLAAVYAFMAPLLTMTSYPPSTVMVELWREFGYLVFAGLFFMLAANPRLYPGVWEVSMFHKAALAVSGLILLGVATDAGATAIFDGTLLAVLIICYLLTRGYSAWGRFREL